MDLRHVTRAGLDYLALGHWHIPSEHQVNGVVRAAYAGSHEPTKFGEASTDGKRVSGQCLVVRIEGPGAAPVLEVHRTAVLDWRQRSVTLSTRADVLALRASLDGEAAASAQTALLDLTVTGSIPAAEEAALGAVETLAAARFLYARVRTKGLLLQPGDNTWLNGLPDGAPQAAAQRLLTQAQGEGRDAEVARLALMRLFELSQEFRA